MEIIGTTASVVSLVEVALTLTRRVRATNDSLQGSSQRLNNASQYLQQIESALGLVSQQESLRTTAVHQQIINTKDVAEELGLFLDKLAIEKQRPGPVQFARVLDIGSADESKLEEILRRLKDAIGLLKMYIQMAEVGILWNMQDGFHVAIKILVDTNSKVKEMLGINLALLEYLGPRTTPPPADGKLLLSSAEVQEFRRKSTTTAHNPVSESDETILSNNVTHGQAQMMTRNIGVESGQRAAGRKTRIEHNNFGDKLRLNTGDVAASAAVSFNENFWKWD